MGLFASDANEFDIRASKSVETFAASPHNSSMATLPSPQTMRRAYQERDAAYDGLFLLGVRTTGIFCRPTCPARKPLPQNVEYFATAKDALASGYRPCKRCQPMNEDAQPKWAAELLADIERDPSNRITAVDLRGRGIDPGTARRHF